MAAEPDYKLCPSCGTEYLAVATRCADCDVELVQRDAVAAEGEDLAPLPPVSELECVRVAPLAWIHALSQALQQRGVAHRVERASAADAPDDQRPEVFGDAPLFGLYVEGEHASPARDLDAVIAAQVLPEQAPALEEGETETCPACGAALRADASECADCGLGFG